MEIIYFLLSFFLSEYEGGKFKPLFDLLKDNSFDLKKTFSSLTPEILAPLIFSLFGIKNTEDSEKNTRTDINENTDGSTEEDEEIEAFFRSIKKEIPEAKSEGNFDPIIKFASQDIINSLDSFFSKKEEVYSAV